MKAISYEGERRMAVSDRPKPKRKEPTDALLRVTTSGICGSDLHMFDGRTPLERGTVVGHEIMGVIEEVGEAVRSIQPGDRVVLPFNVSCGFCHNCTRGNTHACLTMNQQPHAAYGYAGMGPYQGGQAEYVLVPYADFNCLKLPGKPGDQHEDDFLLLSDVFPTAYHATELAAVTPGKTVAIFGAGPVGLLAAHCSLIRGASEVYVVDRVKSRLDKAKELGATPVNFAEGDPVEQIKKIRRHNKQHLASLRPGEAEKLGGVDCAIDAVGYQAHDQTHPSRERAPQVIEYCAKIVNPAGNICLIGVYMAPDPGAKDEQAKQGIYPLPIGQLFDNAVTIGMGQCPVKKYNEYLRDLILQGKAHPGRIVSHHIRIQDAPEAYEKFDKRVEGYNKVLIRFDEAMAA
ncbi:MAG: glutathione-independent formaldehyde dehydrogenase [Acidobacteriaceae bacterium]